jgi:hypothetical protein
MRDKVAAWFVKQLRRIVNTASRLLGRVQRKSERKCNV